MPDGMEEIATRAAWSAVNDGAWDDALAIEKEPYCREIAAAIKALTDAGKIIVDRELTEAKRNEIGETISRMRHTATGGVVAIAVHAIIIGQDTGS